MRHILSIDPGFDASGFVLVEEDSLRPIRIGKESNEALLGIIEELCGEFEISAFVLERFASYGMSIGQETIDSIFWDGRFYQFIRDRFPNCRIELIFRREEKLAICHSPKANDATIHQALVDRFAYGVPNKGKGTKKNPGWFYGFKADIWSAYAVAVTYLDKTREEYNNE